MNCDQLCVFLCMLVCVCVCVCFCVCGLCRVYLALYIYIESTYASIEYTHIAI